MESRNTQDLRKQLESVQAEELLSRFRSKEDLYRYMVHQSNCSCFQNKIILVGLFLPSMSGTKISFLRDILREEKLALK